VLGAGCWVLGKKVFQCKINMSAYKELNIYTKAYELAINVHHASLKLPKFELYEQGCQVRRSSKSIKDTIAEGYGRRRYKADYIKFLVYAQASCDESTSQINMINELYPDIKEFDSACDEYIILGKMINKFIQSIENR
jgi:four helix bundle protein